MKGKILLGLTAILMLTGAAVPVKADDVWKFDAQRFVLKEYTGTETDVVVPDTMDDGVPVKRLGTQLLAGSETLTSVAVPDSVTILGSGALSYDVNLSEITLSSNLINIGWNAISSNDALTELTIPASVCIIDSYAVSGCYALKKIVFEGACPLIGPEAFGTAVDVIIPRTIGGVPVENISYNAFENTRDYVHSDMETNQKEGDWVPMRCVILPETLKSIEDSAFTNCHDLETVICYAPLETTNKGLFSECQGLKKVVFVNGVLHMDNYLFNFCKNLETVWCKNQVDRIGIQTFGVTPMERLCVNAKNIDMSAFAGMESLKEIHIRGGVEHISLGAFAMLPSIETICLEGIDPDVMEDDWANLGNSNLTILVPEDTSDEQLEAIGRKFLSSMIITDGAQVKRGTCSMPEDPMPDIAEMLSAYGI